MTTKFTNTLHVPGKDVSTGQDDWTDCYSVVKSDFFAAQSRLWLRADTIQVQGVYSIANILGMNEYQWVWLVCQYNRVASNLGIH